MSLPSLVGESVRNLRDDGSETHSVRSESVDSRVLNKLHDSVSHAHLKDDTYTSVEDLNKEGALLTDEVDLELNHVDEKVQREDGEVDFHLVDRKLSENELEKQRRRKLMLLKQKQKQKEYISTSTRSAMLSSSASQTSLTHLDDETREEMDRVSRSQERRRQASPQRNHTHDGRVRNSYGEFIKSTCNRPHLARGDSYQSSTEELEPTSSDGASAGGVSGAGAAGANSGLAANSSERSGRSSFRRRLSTEYLRSLSRSLSRDPSTHTAHGAHGAGHGTVHGAAHGRSGSRPRTGDYIDAAVPLSGSGAAAGASAASAAEVDDLLSTNNYPISQAELAQAQVLEQFDEEEEEGVLLDDQGNEEHTREMERAAVLEA